MFPVIQAGSLHLTFIKRESQRLDEVQNRAGREARSPGVSGIPMNLGMYENDVSCQCSPLESDSHDRRVVPPALWNNGNHKTEPVHEDVTKHLEIKASNASL
jgi:hypothetical protein